MKKKIRFLNILFKKKLIRPILRSFYSPEDVAMGVAVGVFWAFMPLVGIQMYLVFMTWAVFKLFRRNFDMVVGMAMVWISNPLTMFFMYYGFYICGVYLMSLAGLDAEVVGYEFFKSRLLFILENPDWNYVERIWEAIKTLLFEFGAAMMIGASAIAVPLAILSYFMTKPLIIKRHKIRAEKRGLSYAEWNEKYVRK